MTWGIKFALASSVRTHGELSDDAVIWATEAIDPPFDTEEEALKACDEYGADSDHLYVFRPFEHECGNCAGRVGGSCESCESKEQD